MTHSFLIFSALPIFHFAFLHREKLLSKKLNINTVAKLIVLLGTPMIYYILRSMFWPPEPEYLWYHTIYRRGIFVSSFYFLPFTASLIGLVLWLRSGKQISSKVLMITTGFLAFAVGVFPYLISGNLDSRATFFFWELGWTSRHQLLMPLGASAIAVAIIYTISEKRSRPMFAIVAAVMISLNIFWGIETYTDSLKKDALIDLLSVESSSIDTSSIVFVDETRHFNFRESAYRLYEFAGILSKAGIDPVPTVEYECGEESDQTEVIVSSDKGLLEAFFSGDLGIRLKMGSCKAG